MTWLTWRQFRAQAITAVAALAAFAILLAVTESHMAGLYAASGITGCHGDGCAGLASQFLIRLTSGRGFPLPLGSNAYVILYFFSVPGGTPALNNCLTSHGIRVAVSYQPVSRYWPLQFAETGLFLALALVLAWYCLWRLNRRLS